MMVDLASISAKAGIAFLFGGYFCFTVAFVMGILGLNSTDAKFQKLNRTWLRHTFLLLTLGLIVRGIWTKAAGGDPLAGDRIETLSLLAWLLCGAALHMHYAPDYKGRKAVWASLFIWGAMLLTCISMGAFRD